MNMCENCEIRKLMARVYDLHWMGRDDCPFEGYGECGAEEEENDNN